MQFSILNYREKLSELIRKRRRAKDLTQREVAKAAGISEKTIKVIESGCFKGLNFTTVNKVCVALGIKITLVIEEGK